MGVKEVWDNRGSVVALARVENEPKRRVRMSRLGTGYVFAAR